MGFETEGTFDIAAASDTLGAELGFGTSEPEELPDDPAPADPAPVEPAPAEPKEGEPAPALTDPAPAPATPAPRTWRPEAAAEWAKLPPVVQAEIAKREEDMFKGLEGYKMEAQVGKAFHQVLAPYEQIFRQYNLDPIQQVNGLLQAHHQLAFGTQEQKVALINKLIQDYGVQGGGEAPYVDPEVQNLRQQLASVQSTLVGMTRAQEQTIRADLNKQIDTFASDPAHPDFDLVANDIAQLISSGAAQTLQEAYDKAIWLNPVTRANQISRETAAKAEAAKKEAEAKAQAARKATAANVVTKPKQASAAAPLGDMDDTLSATLANIKSRA